MIYVFLFIPSSKNNQTRRLLFKPDNNVFNFRLMFSYNFVLFTFNYETNIYTNKINGVSARSIRCVGTTIIIFKRNFYCYHTSLYSAYVHMVTFNV